MRIEPNELPKPGDATPAGNQLADGSSDKTRADDKPLLWLRTADRVVVTLLVLAFLTLIMISWLRLSRWGMADVEITSQQPRETFYSLDINSASWVEWAQLDGIGEKLARRIVNDRDERGPFQNPGDVGRVKGISPRLLETMKPFLRGGTESDR